MTDNKKYTMIVDKMIVNKLGFKLYDKVSAVVSELIANAYDADAELVTINLPIGKVLGSNDIIEVIDDGVGMTPDEINNFYLPVGAERRLDKNRGDLSIEKNRPVMGRKGIGKLSAFGVCKTIEIKSSGGEKTSKGYRVAHLKIEYDEIIGDKNKNLDYHPTVLRDDETWAERRGTTITLKDFLKKRVPDAETLERQLASRFSIILNKGDKFDVKVVDTKEIPEEEFYVKNIKIDVMDGTKISVDDRPIKLENGEELKVNGWAAMAKSPHKNPETAGVRIYVRGKFAATTRDFNQPAGFQGEFVARSYLVGEIHADWLDKTEDLIQTHRQDIIWESEYGEAFAAWGRELIKEVAKRGREPRRERVRDAFLAAAQLEKRASVRFNNSDLEKEAIEVGKQLSGFASEDELEDEEYVKGLSEIILMLTPHKLLFDAFNKIKDMVKSGSINSAELIKLFETTRIAQLASYGQIVEEKLSAMDTFKAAIRNDQTTELELQTILESAPWLIKHDWTVITMNRALSTFQGAFSSWYKKNTEEDIIFLTDATSLNKRPDFIFLHEDNSLIIVEIKPPKRVFDDSDWSRLEKYHDYIEKFFKVNSNFLKDFPNGFKTILIRDNEKVSSTVEKAMKNLKEHNKLETYTWEELLRETEIAHKDFLRARDEMGSKTK